MTNLPPFPGNYPPPGGSYPPPSDGGGYPSPLTPGGHATPPQTGDAYPPPLSAGGSYPPPPAAQGGYAAPAPGDGFGAASPDTYTPWGTRVLAWLIDWLPVVILWFGVIPLILVTMQKVETVCVTDGSEYQLGDFCATGNNGPSTLALILSAVLFFVGLAFVAWNNGLRQGKTGSSIGKGIMAFKIVGEETGQPIGAGKSIARELIYVVAYFVCGIAWLVAVLFPLFDPKRQTLVDKLIKTVALPL